MTLRLSVATKIFLCFAVVLTTFGSVAITSIWTLHRLGEDLGVIGECYLPLTKAVGQIESFHKNKERDTDRILAEKDRATERVLMGYTRVFFPKMMKDRVQSARAVIGHAQKLARGADLAFLGEMDKRLAELFDRYGDYNEAASALYDALAQDAAGRRRPKGLVEELPLPKPPPQRATAAPGGSDPVELRARALKQIEALIGREVQILSTRLESRVASRVNAVHRSEVQAAWAIIALSFAAIALGLLATAIAHRTLHPIRVLTEGVKDISRGDFGREVKLQSEDELGLLAREFNAMAASLREREKQLREQSERLLRSERLAAVGRISAQITHEIRNPLSSIGLNAELLADALEGSRVGDERARSEALSLLAAMAREIDRLTDISEEYLALARSPRGVRESVDLGEVVDDLLELLGPELAQSHVRIERRVDPASPHVRGDPGQLRQALLNLVRNGREAMAPRGGQLTIRVAPAPGGSPAGAVAIEVEDEGPGVAPEELPRLFEPFFSTKEQGTGLGLALTQQIAQDHGGSIACVSAPGRGATFRLILPAEPAVAPPPPSEQATA